MTRSDCGCLETFGKPHFRVNRVIVRALSLCLAVFIFSTSYAQTIQGGATITGDQEMRSFTAAVVVDGVTLFHLRGVSALPAKVRAALVEKQIKAVAKDLAVSASSVRVETVDDRSRIVAAEYEIVILVDADARVEGVSRKVLSEVYAGRIAKAIEAYRHDRRPGSLLLDSVYAVVATVVLVFLLWGVHRTTRKLETVLERRYKGRVQSIEEKLHAAVQAEQIWRALRGLVAALRWLLFLELSLLYLQYVLGLYPWTRGFSQKLLQLVLAPIQRMAISIVEYIPSAIFLIILALLIRFILKAFWILFDAIARESVKIRRFEPEWAWPTYRIVRGVVIVLAVIIAYPYVPGSDSAAFKGISVFVGVLLSLGSSSLVSNIIAGYIMTYRRTFKMGDRVMIENTIGDVMDVRLLVTVLRSIKNEEVVVPNSTILSNQVINYSSLAREKGLILHTTVGVGYDAPWRQVEAMLLMAADRTQGIRKDLIPFVWHTSLGDFAVNYELNVYCEKAHEMFDLYTELHRNILDVFNEYKVQIMTPSYEMDSVQPKIVPHEQWFAAPAKPQDAGVNR